MTLNELFENYLKFMWETFMYDMDVFSQGWIYYCLLIPATFYLMFFIVKWALLLLPFYAPFLIFSEITIYLRGGGKIKKNINKQKSLVNDKP